MTDQIEKKKMSKGCMIGLVAGGVVLLGLAVLFVSCYVYKDDLMRFGVNKLVDSIKVKVDAGEVEGADAEQLTQMTNAFKTRLETGELDYTKYQRFMQSIQAMATDENIDKEDISALMDAMVDYFPDLEEFSPPEDSADSTMTDDATAVSDSTAE